MQTFITISIIIFLLSFVTFVVYGLIVLIQINKTIKEMWNLLKKVNKYIDEIDKTGTKIFAVLSSLMFSSLVSIIKRLFFRRGK